MSKLWKIDSKDTGHEEYLFHCPGCGFGHSFVVQWGGRRLEEMKKAGSNCPTWTFNGDMVNPTFSPSLLYHATQHMMADDTIKKIPRCHLHVRNGMIEYCSDCDHEFAGKTIPLPEE